MKYNGKTLIPGASRGGYAVTPGGHGIRGNVSDQKPFFLVGRTSICFFGWS